VDHAQVLDHPRLQAGGGDERLGRLGGPLQRRHEQRAQRLAVQALRDGERLLAALGRERRVAVAPDELEPGRVDSPPTSMIDAPSAAIRWACSSAAGSEANRPPSENESGVTLSTPMTAARWSGNWNLTTKV
jgi:hypothetical protein